MTIVTEVLETSKQIVNHSKKRTSSNPIFLSCKNLWANKKDVIKTLQENGLRYNYNYRTGLTGIYLANHLVGIIFSVED